MGRAGSYCEIYAGISARSVRFPFILDGFVVTVSGAGLGRIAFPLFVFYFSGFASEPSTSNSREKARVKRLFPPSFVLYHHVTSRPERRQIFDRL